MRILAIPAAFLTLPPSLSYGEQFNADQNEGSRITQHQYSNSHQR